MQIQLCQYVFIILIQHFFQDSLPDIVDGLKQWKIIILLSQANWGLILKFVKFQ